MEASVCRLSARSRHSEAIRFTPSARRTPARPAPRTDGRPTEIRRTLHDCMHKAHSAFKSSYILDSNNTLPTHKYATTSACGVLRARRTCAVTRRSTHSASTVHATAQCALLCVHGAIRRPRAQAPPLDPAQPLQGRGASLEAACPDTSQSALPRTKEPPLPPRDSTGRPARSSWRRHVHQVEQLIIKLRSYLYGGLPGPERRNGTIRRRAESVRGVRRESVRKVCAGCEATHLLPLHADVDIGAARGQRV